MFGHLRQNSKGSYTAISVKLRPTISTNFYLRPKFAHMKLPSPGFLLNAFAAVCRRFPVVMLCTAVGVAACFVLIKHGENHFFTRLWMVCQLGLPLLTGLAALTESKRWNTSRSWLLQGLAVAALAGYFFVNFTFFLEPFYVLCAVICCIGSQF